MARGMRPRNEAQQSTAGSGSDLAPVNVHVAVRCRPRIEREMNTTEVVECRKKEVIVQQKKGLAKNFMFDEVYGPESTQKELYTRTAAPIVDEVLQGFNCTIFAYGQTSTGKTHTMEGGADKLTDVLDDDAGVIPRAVHHVFRELDSRKTEYTVRISCLELYNEELSDLLSSDAKVLKIYEDQTYGTFVHNLEELTVKSVTDILAVLKEASHRRHVAETQLNKASSRSHVVTSLTIRLKEVTAVGEEFIKIGKLNLVDLAGSENIGRSGAQRRQAKEAGSINQSLLTLGRCINALVDRQPHVPYRESKLTRLLQDSLGGRTKTCIIATVSPSSFSLEDTLSTLDYAYRAKNIRNRPVVNKTMTKAMLLRELELERDQLKAELQSQRDKEGVFMSQELYAERERTLEAQRQRIDAMEAKLDNTESQWKAVQELLAEREADLATERAAHDDTRAVLDDTRQTLSQRAEELADTRTTLAATEHLVSHHQNTEQQLLDESHRILADLRASVADVERLHSKVDRHQSLDNRNAEGAEALRTRLQSDLAALTSHTDSWSDRHTTAMRAMHTATDSFLDAKLADLAAVRNAVASMTADFDTAAGAMRDMVADFAAATATQADDVASASAALQARVAAHTQAWSDRYGAAIAGVSAALGRQEADLARLRDLTSAGFAGAAAAVDTFATEHDRRVSEVEGALCAMTEAQDAASRRQQDAFTDWMTGQHRQNEMWKETLTSSISVLISQSMAEQSAKAQQDAAAFTARTREHHTATAAQIANLSTSAKALGDYAGDWTTATATTLRTAADETAAVHDAAAAVVPELRTATEEMRTIRAGDVEALDTHIAENAATAAGYVSRTREATSGFADRHTSAVADAQTAISAHGSGCTEQLGTASTTISEHRATFGETIDTECGDVQTFRSGQRETLAAAETALSEYEYEAYRPHGTTPPKKDAGDFYIPEELPRTMPHEEILKRWREERENDGEGGGEETAEVTEGDEEPAENDEAAAGDESAPVDAE